MKPEYEFFPVEDVEWTCVEGSANGLSERVLAHDPGSGAATHMLRFEPGTDTTPNGVQVHYRGKYDTLTGRRREADWYW